MFAAGQQWSDALTKHGFTADGNRVERSAVEGVPHRDELEPAGGDPGQLEGHADRAGATGCEQDPGKIAGCDLDQAAGELDGGFAGVAAGAEAQGVELLPDRFEDARVRETDLMNIVAVEIEITSAFDIFDPGAFRMLQRV